MKRNLVLIIILFTAFSAIAQQKASVVSGTIDKPFKGYMEVFVKKHGQFRKYGRSNLYDYQKRYAIAAPAGKDDTVKLMFIKNSIKSIAFNDTVLTTYIPLNADSKVKLPLTYQASTKKYLASKPTVTPLQTISAADSVVLIYCSFNKGNLAAATSILSTSDLMPDEKTTASLQFDKNSLMHVLAFALAKPGIVDLECDKIKTHLYVNPGENLRIQVTGETADNFSYNITNASAENNILKEWFDLSNPVSKYGYFARVRPKNPPAAEAFLTDYDKTSALASQFIANHVSQNKAFNTILKPLVSFDLEYSALVYLTSLNNTGLSKHYFGTMIAFKTVPEPMKRFSKSTVICEKSISRLFDFQNYVHLYARLWETMYPLADLPMEKDPNLNKWQLNHMCSAESKAVYLFLELSRYKRVVKNVNDFALKFEPYKNYLLTSEMKALYKEVHDTYYDEAAIINSPIKQIFLPDTSGNKIDISTAFKGKVVLFDLWGTSCGPCRAQIPYWNKIVEEYKDNPNIVFVAISLERNKAYWINHWKEVVRDSDFKAIHLLDVDGNSFWKPNKIGNYGYMLLGKDGIWIENRCPKPEYKDKLKKLIDHALETDNI